MRWLHAKDGDVKIKTWFTLLPVSIGSETRWFERVTVEYRLWIGKASGFHYWERVRFIDKEKE